MIRAPSRGEPLRASWGAAVADGVNALAPMAAPGALARQGVTGFGAQPLPQNRRERRAAAEDSPDAFRVRARVEARTQGDATEKRLVVEMFSSDADMVTWNAHEIGSLGVETDDGLSPATDCNLGMFGWQRIHEGAWADAESFVGDIEVWLRLCLEFRPTTDRGYGPAESSNTGWTLRASAGDDTKYVLPASEGEMGTRQLIRYYRVANVVGGNVTCQDLLGGLHFTEMYPDGSAKSGDGSSGGDTETLATKCVTSLTGDKVGSVAVKGDVMASAANTGFEFATEVKKTANEDGTETVIAALRLEAKGLADGEELAVRNVTIPGKDGEEAKTVKVLATEDFDLSASVLPSAFHATPTWVEKNGGMYVDSITISNCYYMVGGKTMAVGSGWTFTYTASAVIALKLTSTGAGFAAPEVVLYSSLGDAQAAQSSADTYVVPLYEMTNEESGILIDLRTMPQIQAFEFNLT